MDKTKIKSRQKVERKMVAIRVPVKILGWMRENKYSPTGILLEACKEIGYKDE